MCSIQSSSGLTLPSAHRTPPTTATAVAAVRQTSRANGNGAQVHKHSTGTKKKGRARQNRKATKKTATRTHQGPHVWCSILRPSTQSICKTSWTHLRLKPARSPGMCSCCTSALCIGFATSTFVLRKTRLFWSETACENIKRRGNGHNLPKIKISR